MHQIEDKDSNLRIRVKSSCVVGLVANTTLEEIVHNIRVVDLRYTMRRRHILLEM